MSHEISTPLTFEVNAAHRSYFNAITSHTKNQKAVTDITSTNLQSNQNPHIERSVTYVNGHDEYERQRHYLSPVVGRCLRWRRKGPGGNRGSKRECSSQNEIRFI